MNSYKVWCGYKSDGYADNTVTVEASDRADAIKQALEYFNNFWKEEGEEWACFEIQEPRGWFSRTDPDKDEWELRESYLDDDE